MYFCSAFCSKSRNPIASFWTPVMQRVPQRDGSETTFCHQTSIPAMYRRSRLGVRPRLADGPPARYDAAQCTHQSCDEIEFEIMLLEMSVRCVIKSACLRGYRVQDSWRLRSAFESSCPVLSLVVVFNSLSLSSVCIELSVCSVISSRSRSV